MTQSHAERVEGAKKSLQELSRLAEIHGKNDILILSEAILLLMEAKEGEVV